MNIRLNSTNFTGQTPSASGVKPEQMAQFQQFLKFQQTAPVKPKTGVIQGTKNVISGMKKAWINLAEYTKATFNGVSNMLLASGTTFAFARLYNEFKKPKAERNVVKTVANGLSAMAAKTAEAVAAIPKTKPLSIVKNIAKSPVKLLQALKNAPGVGTAGKLATLGTGLAALGLTFFNASLNVSERSANVDHRFNTGHNG